MKIDYDKPVKGKLSNGQYWACLGEFSRRNRVEFRAAYVENDAAWIMFDGPQRPVPVHRGHGWQFYRARLPKTKETK